jgi:hypothetical protein
MKGPLFVRDEWIGAIQLSVQDTGFNPLKSTLWWFLWMFPTPQSTGFETEIYWWCQKRVHSMDVHSILKPVKKGS